MKLLIILMAMLGTGAGAYHSYQSRQLLIEAALLSEAFDLTGPVKLRLTDYYMQHGVMASDNSEAGLDPPQSIFGASVKRVSVNLGGVISVDFDDEVGKRALMLTPAMSPVSGLLSWRCTSDSIEPDVLEKLKPVCYHRRSSAQSQLMHAIANNRGEEVSRLLASDARPAAIVNGNSPLMLAAKIGDVDIVNSLLDAGAPVDHDAVNSQRRTPLMVAISSNHSEVVATLLSHGASVHVTDYQGKSALDYAQLTDERLGGERYVLMLSASFNPKFAASPDAGIDLNAPIETDYLKIYTDLTQSARFCRPKRIRSILTDHDAYKTDDSVDGKSITEHVRRPACSEHLTTYLKTKPIYQQAVRARFLAAARSCETQRMETLLEVHDYIELYRETDGASVLEESVLSGCTEIASKLLRLPNRPNVLPPNLLIKALEKSPSEKLLRMVSILTEAQIQVNHKDRLGRTPLGVAIGIEQPVVAKYLVDAGADVLARTHYGSFPIIDASKKGFDHLVVQLLNNGAEVDVKDRNGHTALLVAVAQGHDRLVDVLLKAGANPRLRDRNGIDAIILAESKQNRKLKLLLTASASNNIDN
ncbi:MAG: ankyrin repeat domain-containing protein [Gammaproteobacteria bacterium]|nr:ankyrin repeat domain-containing protein [Gammaproteobacteria bacterium]